ncbi:MAG TPA: hypothetical protein DCG48_03995 [Rhodospirillaceae bacterium]|nr:hypothetical protein [Rhodospirillaceae bacterium]|tara:strand:- start:2472 stop:2891 length:420 start_codon:yes stop_codon:yes gene_type:complete
MALRFHPKRGAVLVCNFDTGFEVPEMVKRRPVIVVSPRHRTRHGLCTVVPLSTTPPAQVCDYHCTVKLDLPAPWRAPEMWVKADMVATVGFHRLDLIATKRGKDGKRRYLNIRMDDEQLANVQRAMLHGLGLSHLTEDD